jgi:hypothetical protein
MEQINFATRKAVLSVYTSLFISQQFDYWVKATLLRTRGLIEVVCQSYAHEAGQNY